VKPVVGTLLVEVESLRSYPPATQATKYRQVVERAFDALRHVIQPADLRSIFDSTGHLVLMSGGRTSAEQVRLEVNELHRRLAELDAAMTAECERWAGAGDAIVPDTNVLVEVLKGGDTIAGTDWRALAGLSPRSACTVVVPLAVVGELDGLKRVRGEVAKRARAKLRELHELSDPSPADPTTIGDHGVRLALLVPDLERDPLPVTDNEIIEQALGLHSRLNHGRSTKLLSGDLAMITQARLAGLDCVPLEHLIRRDDGQDAPSD
jgi:hypothetical protein